MSKFLHKYSPPPHPADDSVADLFLDEEMGETYKKNFYEVMTMGEMWDWMEVRWCSGLLTGV